MYGIPKDFNLDSIVGSKIVIISRSLNTLNFGFDNKWSIISDGPIKFIEEEKSFFLNGSDEWSLIDPLFSMLEKRIVGWNIESSKIFKILFEDSTSISFIDNSDLYELYHIEPKGWTI